MSATPKAAVRMVVKYLARELAATGIRANMVEPGMIGTRGGSILAAFVGSDATHSDEYKRTATVQVCTYMVHPRRQTLIVSEKVESFPTEFPITSSNLFPTTSKNR